MILEFLHGCNCGNAATAHKNLEEAFRQLGMTPNWYEIDLDSPGLSDKYKRYGSPTILIDGKDISPLKVSSSGGT